MPLVHERTFRVRHYECDAYGHVNHANYLRYMQEAAMDASAAAGYDIARYAALGRLWFVRETQIEYLRPLVYGDAVTVRTWVGDFRRVRSRRIYELRRAGTDELVARAHTDWVYLDAATQRPVSVPPEMIAAFFPKGQPADGARRDPFPPPPPAPPGAFQVERRVAWHELDTAGHVNNANYLFYLEDASVQVAEAFGWPVRRLTGEGYGIFARHYWIEYAQSATLGDTLAIHTWLSDFGRTHGLRHYAVTRADDGAEILRARAAWVLVDKATGRPTRIPDHFRADFAPNASA